MMPRKPRDLIWPVIVMVVLAVFFLRGRRLDVEIVSQNLSHRIVVLDEVELRLRLYLGFALSGRQSQDCASLSAHAILRHGDAVVDEWRAERLEHAGGNVVFHMPSDIPSGQYVAQLKILRDSAAITDFEHVIPEIENVTHRESVAGNWRQPIAIPLKNPSPEKLELSINDGDRSRGFVLWQRHPFRYVYESSAPNSQERLDRLTARLARNEFEPVTFSIYALDALEEVEVNVGTLKSEAGPTIAPSSVSIRVAKSVPRCTNGRNAEAGFEMRPRALVRTSRTGIDRRQSRRFWLTVKTTSDTAPGRYDGEMTIQTPGHQTHVPLSVEVLPIELLPRPDRHYGFLMTYEFLELTAADLDARQHALVAEHGRRTYQSYLEHGLTTIFAHAPFTFQRDPQGAPDLRDLQAALRAFVDVGFSGPFVYYCGHFVQSAKPGWPASTRGWDPDRHTALLAEVIRHARNTVPEMAKVDFYWMPSDEVHDPRGGIDRLTVGAALNDVVKAAGEKVVVSAKSPVGWDADIRVHDESLKGERWCTGVPGTASGNGLPDDAARMRREFGLAFLNTDKVGIVPWTFQVTQHASGDPMTDLDGLRRPEVMVAYPGTEGPIPTPEYEAVREGIDDGRYAYVLETSIARALALKDAERTGKALAAKLDYDRLLKAASTTSLEDMDAARSTIIHHILELGE